MAPSTQSLVGWVLASSMAGAPRTKHPRMPGSFWQRPSWASADNIEQWRPCKRHRRRTRGSER
eukprot:5088117-Pyramimonas_sp.AAC.1